MGRKHQCMSKTHIAATTREAADVLQELSITSRHTKQAVLKSDDCPALSLHRIGHVGWADTRPPYRQVRLQPSGSYALICLEGEGRILLDGRWQSCRPGMACLAPPRVLNAFYAVPRKHWHFCWVRYAEPPGVAPVVNATSPVKTTCNPALLSSAIRGLIAEHAGAAEARLIHHWVELIHAEVERLSTPWQVDRRLGEMWERVGRELGAPWSAEALARLAHCSKEHLRRLCLRELGRTPMQHVTSMRMQRAAELLEQGSEKLATIAEAVGYGDAFVLSKLFKRWTGCSPSVFRTRSGKEMN